VTIIGILFLCVFVEQNLGLQCYTCDGNSKATCNDQFDKENSESKTFLGTCVAPADTCKKEKTKDKVIRGCIKAADCKEKDENGKVTTCCKADGCNGATSLQVSGLLLLPAAVFFYLYK